ncbi:MAG: hypothetical protein KAR06_01795 [Deltaproteobacteria bacterium]|nr:hypothetical protein [Deltaproteobacteria bacterium]
MAEDKHWRCTECGMLHIGAEPPDVCEDCLAPKGAFVLVEEEVEEETTKTVTQ